MPCPNAPLSSASPFGSDVSLRLACDGCRAVTHNRSQAHGQTSHFIPSAAAIPYRRRPAGSFDFESRRLHVGTFFLPFGGNPRINAGAERFSAPKKLRFLSSRFSAGQSTIAPSTVDSKRHQPSSTLRHHDAIHS
jgi:hypothetical protein